MVRKKVVKIYKFEELSAKAKERAMDAWRHSGNDWDDMDSNLMSENFKMRLEEKGLDKPDVNWGLGHTQGDGVCFSGTFDLEKFFKENPGYEKFKEYEKIAGAWVKKSGRSCHWNSMTVETEMAARHHQELLPKEMFEKLNDWEIEESRRLRLWQGKNQEALRARQAPIVEWERRAKYFKSQPGAFEWYPDIDTSPPPLDFPLPDPLVPKEMPAEMAEADAWAKAEFERLEKGLNDFEEALGEWVKDMSRELAKDGYAEIEYRSSDEAISETLIANEYEYTEDGERWKD